MGELRSLWLVLVLVGCTGSAPQQAEQDAPLPPPATGLVTEPAQGLLVRGDPGSIMIHVAGTFDKVGSELAVQVLSNPDDLTSWTTIATTTAQTPQNETFEFAVDVQPVAGDPDRPRWPVGGVLRLRVIDSDGLALPYDVTEPNESVIAIANPPVALPIGWKYLSEEAPGSITETQAYYTTINAPATLDAFMTLYGFPGDETTAVYYNAGDLGIGREMHCRTAATGQVACYVRNYGVFGGTKADSLAALVAAGIPLATVAMVYTPPITAPNAIAFLVYGGDNALINEAQLDTKGDNKSIPQNCLNCHGGRSSYDLVNHAAIGARFLPFDPSMFDYDTRPDLTFAAQEEKFRRLDRLVVTAAPTVATQELIEGMFPLANTPYDPTFVPAGWTGTQRETNVYRTVIAPFCRSCHASMENQANDPLAFTTAAQVRAKSSSVVSHLCGAGPKGMPSAEATSAAFFASPARAVMLQWLGAPGACAPVTN